MLLSFAGNACDSNEFTNWLRKQGLARLVVFGPFVKTFGTLTVTGGEVMGLVTARAIEMGAVPRERRTLSRGKARDLT